MAPMWMGICGALIRRPLSGLNMTEVKLRSCLDPHYIIFYLILDCFLHGPQMDRYIWSIHHQATIRAKHGTRKVHLNSWSRPSLFLPDIGQFPAWPPDGPVYVEHSPPVLHLDQTCTGKVQPFLKYTKCVHEFNECQND